MPREKSDLVRSNDRTAAIIRNLSEALGRMGGGDLDLLRLTGDDHPLHNEIARLLREDFVVWKIEYNEQWLRNMIMKSGLIHVDDVIRRCNYKILEMGEVRTGTHLRLYKLEETLDYSDVRNLLDRFPDWYTANVFELLTFYMRYGRVLNGREVVALGTKMTTEDPGCNPEECCPRLEPAKDSTNPRQMYRMVVESTDTMYSAGTWLLLSHKPEIS